MAQQKTADTQKKDTQNKKEIRDKTEQSERKPIDLLGDSDDENLDEGAAEEEVETHFWEDLRDTLPPWLDEVVAFALLIFGTLSFLALVVRSEAVAAVAWTSIMTQLFGYGSYVVSIGLLGLGLLIFLPKFGIHIRFSPLRILAIEILFLCVLAILHMVSGDEELRAIARAGQGGGLIGWGLSFPLSAVVGNGITILFYSIILLISLGIVVGITRKHVTRWLNGITLRLQTFSDRLVNKPLQEQSIEEALNTDKQYEQVLAYANQRTPLMRIRPNPGSLPPSLRNAPAASPHPPEDDMEDLTNHPLFTSERNNLQADFNVIGEKTGKKSKDGKALVARPDGRTKRYFTIDEMKETKKMGRRDKNLPELEELQDIELNLPDEEEINHNVVLIENTLMEFDIDIDVVDVQVGPTVTRYAVQPFRADKSGQQYDRTRLSKIASYANDLSLALSAKRLRLEIPVPGTNFMGIEVPNKNPSLVALRSVYESKAFYDVERKKKAPLFIPLGRDVSGAPVGINLAEMPHLLIAGTTGSGKSVCIAAIATALILNNMPDKVKMVMLDPKMVELSRFNSIPHLLGPVETDTERIIGVLRWCTREMDRRYKMLEEKAARNIDIYNSRYGSRRRGGEYLPHIVILVDEIGDLMLSEPEETEKSLTRLAQMARAVGMHMVVATQRPSVDVITGLIKANFPSRIAFAVASGVDSRVILDSVGAETLLGKGDMLYQSSDAAGPKRIQGCFVSDEEVRAVVKHWVDWNKRQIAAGKSKAIYVGPWERGLTRREFLAETDPMLEDAIELVVKTQEASASMIQRELGLGYPRAARIMDMLEELGVVGDVVVGGRARKVMIEKGQDPFKKLMDKRMKHKSD